RHGHTGTRAVGTRGRHDYPRLRAAPARYDREDQQAQNQDAAAHMVSPAKKSLNGGRSFTRYLRGAGCASAKPQATHESEILRYKSSTTQGKAVRWIDSTSPISSSGTCRFFRARPRSLPPLKPVQPNVSRSCRLAHSTARNTLGLFPDPLIAISRSPGL